VVPGGTVVGAGGPLAAASVRATEEVLVVVLRCTALGVPRRVAVWSLSKRHSCF
jgi:hypothetical protein